MVSGVYVFLRGGFAAVVGAAGFVFGGNITIIAAEYDRRVTCQTVNRFAGFGFGACLQRVVYFSNKRGSNVFGGAFGRLGVIVNIEVVH